MTGIIPVSPKLSFQDANGGPLANGTLTVYLAGTTTPTPTWQDKAQLTLNTNPVVLDARGECLVWLNPLSNYKFLLKDSTGAAIYTVDNINGATNNSDSVMYQLAATGSTARTVESKLMETVSVTDFGVVGDGSDEYAGILNAWLFCLANEKNLYFPAGVYSSGINNMPFKNATFPAASLLDCKNITIYGDGPATVLRSDSIVGADVLNLYSVKNLHIRNIAVRAAITGSAAGSNGCSIVGGFDNITIDGLWCYDLPYVDYGTYLDGGKALTVQPGIVLTECGTVKATRVYAKGCVFGFDLSVDLVNWATKKHIIDVEIVAEDCFVGAVCGAGAATGALSEGMTMGLTLVGRAVNCQQDVQLGRVHGVAIDMEIVTTKTAAARRLNPSGTAWNSTDSIVTGIYCNYAKNSIIRITGDKGGCDFGARIGGATAGSSGFNGSTEFCNIILDYGCQSVTSDFELLDSGGNTISNTKMSISLSMSSSLPVALYTPANQNTIFWGNELRINSPIVNGNLGFAYTNGAQVLNTLERQDLGMYFKQTGSSSANTLVAGVKNNAGSIVNAIRNDGTVATAGRATASAVSTVRGVLPLYTEANVLWGYVPVYTSFTP